MVKIKVSVMDMRESRLSGEMPLVKKAFLHEIRFHKKCIRLIPLLTSVVKRKVIVAIFTK